MEWGITWQQYMDTPFEVIGKIKEYMLAKNEGMVQKEKRKELDMKFKQQVSNMN